VEKSAIVSSFALYVAGTVVRMTSHCYLVLIDLFVIQMTSKFGCSFAMNFYVLLRAVDRLAANYNRCPGIFERLKTAAVSVMSEMGMNGAPLSEDLITEMCRFGGAEIHPVAAFIGGVASQEVIKVCFDLVTVICGQPLIVLSSH
jgi:hypothetical protein